MSEKAVTINLPETLYKRLVEKAAASNRLLESLIVDFIQHCLEEGEKEEGAPEKSLHERELEALKRTGLVKPLGEGWKKYLAASPEISRQELREMLKGIPPLSADIIAERDEGRGRIECREP